VRSIISLVDGSHPSPNLNTYQFLTPEVSFGGIGGKKYPLVIYEKTLP
jgi:hypothetical protein